MTKVYIETDENYRARIANTYGMWGAFLTEVIESSGTALDECGDSIGVKRLRLDVFAAEKRSGE